jgi:hypothetical protein
MAGKQLAAICPLCQHAIPLSNHAPVNEDIVRRHMESHSLTEWVQCVQALRNVNESELQLRQMPRCAMPQA